jgi:hypothetical protein
MPWAVLAGGAPMPAGRRFVEAEVALREGATSGGVAIGFRGTEDLLSLGVTPSGAATLQTKRGGSWTTLGAVDAPEKPPAGAVRLRLGVEDGRLCADVGGVRALAVPLADAGLGEADLEGRAALLAEGGEVRFERVRTGAQP